MIEHRQGIRRRALALVKIQSMSNDSVGLMYDISSQGMFVLTDAVPKMHECINIYMLSPDSGRAVPVTGLVIHGGKHGFGVMFYGLDGKAREMIKKYIDRFESSYA